jgi:hypothetical protein
VTTSRDRIWVVGMGQMSNRKDALGSSTSYDHHREADRTPSLPFTPITTASGFPDQGTVASHCGDRDPSQLRPGSDYCSLAPTLPLLREVRGTAFTGRANGDESQLGRPEVL